MKTLTFETSLMGHHKLIATMLWSTFARGKPNKTFCSCYKNFENEKFGKEVKTQLFLVSDFELIHLAFKINLNQFAGLKEKIMQNNNQGFMTKALAGAVMKIPKL